MSRSTFGSQKNGGQRTTKTNKCKRETTAPSSPVLAARISKPKKARKKEAQSSQDSESTGTSAESNVDRIIPYGYENLTQVHFEEEQQVILITVEQDNNSYTQSENEVDYEDDDDDNKVSFNHTQYETSSGDEKD